MAFNLLFGGHFSLEQHEHTNIADRSLFDEVLFCLVDFKSPLYCTIGSARVYKEQVAASPGLRLRLCKYRRKGVVGVYE